MTKDEKMKAIEMRKEGFSFRAIAKEIGYTPQNICHQLMTLGIERGVVKNIKTIIYKGLANWMIENEISINALSLKIYDKYYNAKCDVLAKKLRGERNLYIGEIKKILEVTGMTFEECFEEREVKNV